MFSCELGDMTKIYVWEICRFSADESQVRALFAQHGTVESVNVIMDRETGRPRGFAFVGNEQCRRHHIAIQGLNGYSMGGRARRAVNEAQDRPPGGGGRGPGGGGAVARVAVAAVVAAAAAALGTDPVHR